MTDADLQTFYVSNLDPQISAIEVALDALERDEPGAVDSMRRVAHQLKGSGTSYGFPEVTDRAAAVLAASGDELLTTAEALLDVLQGLKDEWKVSSCILIVDDDRLMQALLQRVLDAPDRTILQAASRAEAIERLQLQPDLVLLDLFLPDADGRDVLGEMRSSPDWASIPVIVLSGADAELARIESLALGADAFMGKPFDPEALQTLAASLLQVSDPVRHRPPPTPAGDRSALPTSAPLVLVAEDDDLVASLIIDRLERDGFESALYFDGETALEAVRDRRPDLVILDVKMPRMDGFETLSRIKSDPDIADIPVIVLTAMGSEHDVVRGFALGAADYVLKPFSPTELTVRVRRLVDTT